MAEIARWCNNAGVRLEYLVWPASHPRGLAVVLIPGTAAPAAYWSQHAGFVAGVGGKGARTVIAISLRGTGASDCPATGWTPEHHHADVAAVLQVEAVERCHLVGHSVGGAHALGFALGSPAVAASVTMGDFPPVLPAYTEAWVERLESWEEKHFHPAFPRRLAKASRRIDYGPRLGELDVPLLVIQGTGPGSLLEDEHLSRFEGARHLEVVKVDAGHDVFESKRCPEACADFMARAEARLA